MALVTSLLTAIVRADGDALVLHAGERPYVVAPQGQTELASRALTFDAMKGMLKELLPSEAQQTLADVGAVQHEIPSPGFARSETFTVIAARGGDDIWIEIRRHRAAPIAPIAPEAPVAPMAPVAPEPLIAPVSAVAPEPEPEPQLEPEPEPEPQEWTIELTTESLGDEPVEAGEQARDADGLAPEVHEISLDADVASVVELEPANAGAPSIEYDLAPNEPAPLEEPEAAVELAAMVEPEPAAEAVAEEAPEPPVRLAPAAEHPPAAEQPPAAAEPEPEPRPAIVLPLSRTHARVEHPVRFPQPHHTSGIDRLLRIAAARGASTLYLTSQARPSIRVDGEIGPIDGEGVLAEPDVEALILDVIPERSREALRSQAGIEWVSDLPDVGRIRGVTFRDHRGAGAIFRMMPPRAISAEQLGLSREIQGLCAEDEGLVLLAGPRSSGKSRLISSFVDLVNRTRSEHVITLETQIAFVHENRLSFVSQREVRGDRNEVLLAARAAMRENPDVLVIEDLESPDLVALALEAAQSGRLVIGALTAHTATDAVDRIVDQTPPERRQKMQAGLAENLRGIVAQVLVRKAGGGRVAAREVLLNTGAVANLIAEGRTSQLPAAIEAGRRRGMVSLNDALVALVQAGAVDSSEAFRRTADQQGFLAQLERQGIDTSFVERLA